MDFYDGGRNEKGYKADDESDKEEGEFYGVVYAEGVSQIPKKLIQQNQ